MDTAAYATRIQSRLDVAGLTVPTASLAALAQYLDVLARWNRRINLTAFSLDQPSDAAIDRLIVEPVAAAAAVRDDDRVAIDIGSGGGSPALPLKIVRPQLQMLLTESRERKSAFLREAVRSLSLPDVVVQTTRVGPEGLAHANGTADIVTMRAVRADADMWRAIESLLVPRGRVLWFREHDPLEAVAAPDGWTFEARPLVGEHMLVIGIRGQA